MSTLAQHPTPKPSQVTQEPPNNSEGDQQRTHMIDTCSKPETQREENQPLVQQTNQSLNASDEPIGSHNVITNNLAEQPGAQNTLQD